MTFQPQSKQEINLDGVVFHIAEHPAAPGMPYGQEGRAAVVYQLTKGDDLRALKVFKPRFRVPGLVSLARRLAPFADMPGLQVCRRTVLTHQQHATLLRQHPDLTYAVLMPWVVGPTWLEVMLDSEELSPAESLTMARALGDTLANMEQDELAHCDLSGPNLLLPMLTIGYSQAHHAVALVDVEQMHGPDLRRPELLPAGSPGYAHKTAVEGLWSPEADRFAGAVLLAEILAWCDSRIREQAWGESYFDPGEMQQNGERYRLMVRVLWERWGEGVARLFVRAWDSDALVYCATFGEWMVMLPDEVPGSLSVVTTDYLPVPSVATQPQHPPSVPQPLLTVARHEVGTPEAVIESRSELPRGDEGIIEPIAQYAVQGADESEVLETVVHRAVEPVPPVAVAGARSKSPTDQPGQLFDDGLAAYKRGEWAQARELLGEVIRRQPGYRQGKYQAARLFLEAERRLAAPPRPQRNLSRLVMPALLLIVLLIGGGIAVYQATSSRPDQAPAAGAQTAATKTAEFVQATAAIPTVPVVADVATHTAQASPITSEPATIGTAVSPTATQEAEPTLDAAQAAGLPAGCLDVQLQYWTQFTGPDGLQMQKIVDDFNSAHPVIRVTMQVFSDYSTNLDTAQASGTLPDVAIINDDSVATRAFQGTLRPMDGITDKVGISGRDFPQAAWSTGQVAGKTYGVPLSFVVMAMYYNEDMLQADGIYVPPTTAQEFDIAAAAMTKNGEHGFMLTTSFPIQQVFQQLLHQFGGAEFSSDGTRATWNSEAGVKALEWMVNANSRYGLPNLEVDAELNAFKAGDVGMVWNGMWQIPSLTGASVPFSGMVAPIPQIGHKPAVWAGGSLFTLPSQREPDRCKDAAAGIFIKYVLDNSLEWAKGGSIPASNAVRNSPEFKVLPHSMLGPSLEYAVLPPPVPGVTDAFVPLGEAISSVMSGSSTDIKAALDAAAERADQVLADNKRIYGDRPKDP